MSIRFKIVKNIVKMMGFKKMFALPKDELLAKAKKSNKGRDFHMPKDKKYCYGDEVILNHYHCLKIGIQEKKTKKALLFLWGSAMIIGPDQGAIKTAISFGVRSGRDVWFPYYPLCTDYCVTETYNMLYETYRHMVAEYGADNIAILGFSAGGALAIGLCLHNNVQPEPLPMPEVIIASSPGFIPVTEEEKADIQKLNKVDIMVDAALMKTICEIMKHGNENTPEYMLSGTLGDFTDLPMIHFYYGSDEVLSAAAKPYAKACEKYGAKYQMHFGKGMCHCYPMMTFCPEGKQANEEIATLLKAQ